MIIHHNPDDYVTEVESRTCPYHKKNPGKIYAGCTCSFSITQRKKTLEEKAEDNGFRPFGQNIKDAINTLL